MTISERLDQDIKDAMRARQTDRLGVLRMLKAALKNAAIEKHGPGERSSLDDADAQNVLRKQVKQRQDSIESFTRGGRPEQAAKEQAEIDVLQSYLPRQLSAEELDTLVTEAIAETGATGKAQMGAVMKVLTPKVAGRADGRALSQAVQRRLG